MTYFSNMMFNAAGLETQQTLAQLIDDEAKMMRFARGDTDEARDALLASMTQAGSSGQHPAGALAQHLLNTAADLPDAVRRSLQGLAQAAGASGGGSEGAAPGEHLLERAFKAYAIQASAEKFLLPGIYSPLPSFPGVDLGDLFVALGTTGSILNGLANSAATEGILDGTAKEHPSWYLWKGKAALPIYTQAVDNTRFARKCDHYPGFFQTPEMLKSESFVVASIRCQGDAANCECMFELGDGRGWIAVGDMLAIANARLDGPEVMHCEQSSGNVSSKGEGTIKKEQKSRRYRRIAMGAGAGLLGCALLATGIGAVAGALAVGAGSAAGAAGAVGIGGAAALEVTMLGTAAVATGVSAVAAAVAASGAPALALSVTPVFLAAVATEGLTEAVSNAQHEANRQSRLFFVLMALAKWEHDLFHSVDSNCDLVDRRCEDGQVCMTSGAFFQTGGYARSGVCVHKLSLKEVFCTQAVRRHRLLQRAPSHQQTIHAGSVFRDVTRPAEASEFNKDGTSPAAYRGTRVEGFRGGARDDRKVQDAVRSQHRPRQLPAHQRVA